MIDVRVAGCVALLVVWTGMRAIHAAPLD